MFFLSKNGDFSASVRLRKGAINPENPLEIEWSSDVLSFSIKGYRPAATTVYGDEVEEVGLDPEHDHLGGVNLVRGVDSPLPESSGRFRGDCLPLLRLGETGGVLLAGSGSGSRRQSMVSECSLKSSFSSGVDVMVKLGV